MLGNFIVQLRDHPQMNFAGYPNWPPIWVTGGGSGNYSGNYKKRLGEIGILIGSILHDVAPGRLFLRMEIDYERYTGCLAFSDAVFCRQLHEFLQGHTGKSIKEIGGLDFSHTL